MCGIVGYVTLKPRAGLANFLGQGLIVDSLRGMCGTGIYGWNDKEKEALVWKRALAGADFVNTLQFNNYKEHVQKMDVVIGHNRASTIGSAKDVNCHPFVFDHIGLVHNGTLRNYTSLFKHTEFSHAVDSAYAAKAISVYGAVPALEKIDGAFVFVWHDSKANTFNITRNSMRDIWYITDKEGENLYYASEYQMLDWLLDRNNLSVQGKYRSPAEFSILTWELGKPLGKPKITPYNEYTPPKIVYGSEFGGGWHRGRGFNRDEEDLADLGVEQFEMLKVKDWAFELYSPGGDKGRVSGTVEVPPTKQGADPLIYKFRYHGLSESEVEGLKQAPGILVSANSVWWEGKDPVITCRVIKPLKAEEVLPDSEDLFQGPEGRWFAKDDFIKLIGSGCGYCSEAIDITKHQELKWILMGTGHEPICERCATDPVILQELEWYQSVDKSEGWH